MSQISLVSIAPCRNVFPSTHHGQVLGRLAVYQRAIERNVLAQDHVFLKKNYYYLFIFWKCIMINYWLVICL